MRRSLLVVSLLMASLWAFVTPFFDTALLGTEMIRMNPMKLPLLEGFYTVFGIVWANLLAYCFRQGHK